MTSLLSGSPAISSSRVNDIVHMSYVHIFLCDCGRRHLEIRTARNSSSLGAALQRTPGVLLQRWGILHLSTRSHTLKNTRFCLQILALLELAPRLDRLDVHSRGNDSSNSKITGSHMNKSCGLLYSNTVLCVLFVKLLPACILCAALKQSIKPGYPVLTSPSWAHGCFVESVCVGLINHCCV